MDEPRFIVSTQDLAEILGLSKRRVQQLATSNDLPRLKDPDSDEVLEGKWDLRDCTQAYIRFKIGSVQSVDELDTHLKQEKLRRARAEADLREDLRDRERAKLFHAEDVMTALSDCMSQIKARVLSLPARLTLPLLGQRDAAVVNELLTEAVTELLGTIRNYSPEDFRSPDLPELIEQGEQTNPEEVSEAGQ